MIDLLEGMRCAKVGEVSVAADGRVNVKIDGMWHWFAGESTFRQFASANNETRELLVSQNRCLEVIRRSRATIEEHERCLLDAEILAKNIERELRKHQ